MRFNAPTALFNAPIASGGGFNAPPVAVVTLGLLESLYARLKAKTSWSVYPYRLPQKNSFPCLTYRVVTNTYGHNLQGSDTTATARIQIDCWAKTYRENVTQAEDLRNCLQGFQGLMCVGGITVMSCRPIGKHYEYEQPANDSDSGIHHTAVDYRLTYRVDRTLFTWSAGPTQDGSTIDEAVISTLQALDLAVYAGHRPQKSTLPSVMYEVTGLDQSGILTGAGGWASAKVALTVFTDTLAGIESKVETIRLALDGYYGLLGGVYVYSSTVDDLTIDRIRKENDSDDGTFSGELGLTILYQELLPSAL